ncbi:PREDICTED: pachytene checkpoint protein 2 homolog isoform X2 [Amphimedon queenslandica]|uniref:Pachytene checkpoint protein 2 homolog n=1 Tax=Amphimedon queenslandica TaxID=400682 RepID=A0AAN0IX31_AMPQE|nr:PREDICTED: pachytene checkpoint protein 2 homolog isoform X2 [Amphimedon queenslandica]|eukprot:XP_019849117.1 PREDICTED: pachytene checkpoint protein 2 homolog isoform X2 [Amphimedon queenslandica]
MQTSMQELSESLPSSSLSSQIDTVHVEVCQNIESTLPYSLVREQVRDLLLLKGVVFGEFVATEFSNPLLQEHILSVTVTDISHEIQIINFSLVNLLIHVFKLSEEGPSEDQVEEETSITAATHWLLPNVEYHNLWDSLIYEPGIKQKLLNYAETTLLFSDKGVDSTIISWNRVVLLHGPPGTGKTSLCKALAQKLCIRLSDRYSYGQLVEINSHSLFSKWFSESGKLVQKMFSKIHTLVEDDNALICILIDEVESLTVARNAAMSGSEPSDAIRVVNALLTQIDQIKRYPNVLILTTSNITEAIDLAFVDRADIKQYIGLPSLDAVFSIFMSCIKELMRVGIIAPVQQVLGLRKIQLILRSISLHWIVQ